MIGHQENCSTMPVHSVTVYKRNRKEIIWYGMMVINSYLKSKTTTNTQQEEKLEMD